ncbi:NAD(P)/FAD-dependent oxidoreductase [Pararhodobacter sp. CCB-MM2]|uniref:FAD/NAD(P)-dependent oxidoreductase n=1 Tax=Pararhodobacter sp. CCB-MM2 TaxID=1786003 RepID=UPI0009F39386|nr:NAD(P)/FAD-dependent oxidoreductase [Pararhodobacter sp. CCB-MM2]
MTDPDLLIIGGGIAGLAAARTARNLGLGVTLADDRPAVGGNILAGVGGNVPDKASAIVRRGAALIEAASKIDLRSGTQALRIDADLTTQLVTGAAPVETLHPKRLLLATGALERPVPLKGGTLPGVMMAGAAQLLLKTSGALPTGRTILAGSGPLLYLVAKQMISAGVTPAALVETTPRQSLRDGLAGIVAARHAPEMLWQGAAMLLALRRAGVPWYRQASELTVLGEERAEGLRFRDAQGVPQKLRADLILLHDGVIPNDHATRSLGCAEIWHDGRQAYQPQADLWGETRLPGVFVAGDCAGVTGAAAAEQAGILAALQIAYQLGQIDAARRDALACSPRRILKRQTAFRPFLEARYPPRLSVPAALDDAVIVCRCENVTAGALRAAIRHGATGADQLKSFTRCGMGRCQGRSCALAMTGLIASETGTAMNDLRRQSVRAPLKPVPLGQIAGLPAMEEGA